MFRYTQGDAKVSCLPLKRCTENENYVIKGMTTICYDLYCWGDKVVIFFLL